MVPSRITNRELYITSKKSGKKPSECLNKSLKWILIPMSPSLHTTIWRGPTQPKVIYIISEGYLEKPSKHFKTFLKYNLYSMDACNHLKKAYTAQGNRCYQEGKLDEAIWFFQDAMKLSPDDKLHNNLGEVL